MTPEEIKAPQYLGDSVYAEFDGYNVVLTTNNGYSDDPRNRIALEPDVIAAFRKYDERLREQIAAYNKEHEQPT